jgi:MFS family permease
VKPALRALRHKTFRIFFAGQGLSLLGTWMQTVAMSWLVYRLTGSAWLLGVTAGAQQLPMLFLSPIAGVLADRVNRQRLLVLIQSLAFLQSLSLALLTFAGIVDVPHVIALAVLLGIINAFEMPTRQAFVLELVQDRQDLPNAIALQSMLFQSARFLGPSVAGLILAAFGEAWCFLINAASYLIIVAAYALIRVTPRPRPDTRTDWRHELISGFRYAFGFLGTRRLLLLLSVLGFFSAPWSSLMPLLAAESFAGDSRTFGFLIGSVGLGAFVGTLFLVLRASVRGLGRVVAVSSITAGIALSAFSLSRNIWVSLALLSVFGFGIVVTAASTNTILQTVADEDKRARVISLYGMSFLGAAPIGNFTAGAIAEAAGVHETLFACGLAVVLAGVAFGLGLKSWSRAVRAVYVRQGIITVTREER